MTSSGIPAEIKSKLPVAELIGETVALKRAGSAFKGLCPFHAEKTPSFIVSPDRETWHCFGCGEGGDIFTFVMKRDGLEFREALTRLAEKAGVELSERTAQEDRRKRRLREALEAAIAWYREVLLQTPQGERARRLPGGARLQRGNARPLRHRLRAEQLGDADRPPRRARLQPRTS